MSSHGGLPLLAELTWTEESASAPWTPRLWPALVILSSGDVVLIAGQLADASSALADVWGWHDSNSTWTLLTGDAGFAGRSLFAAVVLSDDTIVVMGGQDTSGSPLSDVWTSVDGGRSFSQATASAEWGARSHVRACALSDDTLFLLGGGTSADLWTSSTRGASWSAVGVSTPRWASDFTGFLVALPDDRLFLAGAGATFGTDYVSTNRGASWQFRTNGAPPLWGARSDVGVVIVGDTVVVVGGRIGGDYRFDAWREVPGGHWVSIESGAAWGKRDGLGIVALPNGDLLMAGGSATNSDVWRLTRGTGWSVASCREERPFLCGAPARTVAVAVGLDAAASAFVPEAAPLASKLVARYTPPVPTITLLDGTDVVSPTALWFNISWSHPVTGLVADDLDVHVDATVPPTSVEAVLSGTGAVYELEVRLQGNLPPCPPGFTLAEAADRCVMATPATATWNDARAACAPYDLASLTSEDELPKLVAAAGGSDGLVYDYWSVVLLVSGATLPCGGVAGCDVCPVWLCACGNRIGAREVGHYATDFEWSDGTPVGGFTAWQYGDALSSGGCGAGLGGTFVAAGIAHVATLRLAVWLCGCGCGCVAVWLWLWLCGCSLTQTSHRFWQACRGSPRPHNQSCSAVQEKCFAPWPGQLVRWWPREASPALLSPSPLQQRSGSLWQLAPRHQTTHSQATRWPLFPMAPSSWQVALTARHE